MTRHIVKIRSQKYPLMTKSHEKLALKRSEIKGIAKK
jgi:hypothetical protein